MTAPIVWFTGLPASGKSTLATRVRHRFDERRQASLILDSDEIRDALGVHGYDDAARDAFYRALGNLAAVVAHQDVIALVAATAARQSHRDHVQRLAQRLIVVLVDVPLATCQARDPKRLYEAARDGHASALPGVGAPYESPAAPDVVAHGGFDNAAVDAIVELVERAGLDDRRPALMTAQSTPAR